MSNVLTAGEALSQIQEQAEKIKSNATCRFPEAASPGDTHRQGDLYITLLVGLPQGAKPIEARSQIATGTNQGSRHCLDSLEGVTMFERGEATAFDGPILNLTQERTVTHPEHGHVVLPAGCYGIGYQRDLDSEERERRVQD